MDKDQKITMLAIAGLLLVLIVAPFAAIEALARTYPEQIYKEIYSPDGAQKLTITHYKQYIPYGVRGYIYLEKNGRRERVSEFFLDFIEDVELKDGVSWSDEAESFYFGGEKLQLSG